MDAEIERWRKYLRRDPTRFLLDEEANPSVYLWYLIDVVHRPEDATAVVQARERVLYSRPVPEIFAAQQPEGFWENAESLAEPRYRATLWNLALLAELGVPRDSRRARSACEFALQNFLDPAGHFVGLDSVEAAHVVRALAYFNPAGDERVRRAAAPLAAQAARDPVSDEVRVTALQALALPSSSDDPQRAAILNRLLDSLAARAEFGPITFPPFDPSDPLFILRVLGEHGAARDPRAARLVEFVMQKQNELGQWPLEKSLSGKLWTRVEEESPASRWATLNAVRVVVRLVLG